MRVFTVTGGDGVALSVTARGPKDCGVGAATVVFTHGFSMSSRVWKYQLMDTDMDGGNLRLVAWDLRGHGRSGRPVEREAYRNQYLWAADLDAVVRATRGEGPVVLVSWSYGARVMGDYLRTYGDGAIAGVVFVGARVMGDAPDEPRSTGPGLSAKAGMLSPDRRIADAATERFVRGCFATLPDENTFAEVVDDAKLVPYWVREAMDGRELNTWTVAASTRVPVMVVHGSEDQMFTTSAAYRIAELFSGDLHLYPDAGHAPFIDDPHRFNDDLVRFVDSLAASRS